MAGTEFEGRGGGGSEIPPEIDKQVVVAGAGKPTRARRGAPKGNQRALTHGKCTAKAKADRRAIRAFKVRLDAQLKAMRAVVRGINAALNPRRFSPSGRDAKIAAVLKAGARPGYLTAVFNPSRKTE